MFIGKVEDQPQIAEQNGRKQAFLVFVINDRTQGANGQWVDRPMRLPVYAYDNKAELIEKYIVAGQELTIECKYKNWEAQGQMQHAFILLNVSFGFKPKNTATPSAAPMGGPPA
jgi:hypothetical protein